MNTISDIAAIELRVKALGLTMAFVCRRAGIPPETWGRWKAGGQGPTKAKWDSLASEVTDLEERLRK